MNHNVCDNHDSAENAEKVLHLLQKAHGARCEEVERTQEKPAPRRRAPLPPQDEGIRLFPEIEPEGQGEADPKGGFALQVRGMQEGAQHRKGLPREKVRDTGGEEGKIRICNQISGTRIK